MHLNRLQSVPLPHTNNIILCENNIVNASWPFAQTNPVEGDKERKPFEATEMHPCFRGSHVDLVPIASTKGLIIKGAGGSLGGVCR